MVDYHDAQAWRYLAAASSSSIHGEPLPDNVEPPGKKQKHKDHRSWKVRRKGVVSTLNEIKLDHKTHKWSAASRQLNFQDFDMNLKDTDQYLGYFMFKWEGKERLCIHWASRPSSGKLNIQNMVEWDATSNAFLSRGRCLVGEVGAHNLCVVANGDAVEALKKDFDTSDKYLAFAIGGEYRHPDDPRGKSISFNGISLYGLVSNGQKWKDWASFHFEKIKLFLNGDHPGQTEGRGKCGQGSSWSPSGFGYSEFDGQSALTFWKGEYWVYARSNPRESGYRSVQVCDGRTLGELGKFEMCTFSQVEHGETGYDGYFLHPYVLHNKKGLVALMSFVPADEFKTPTEPAGVYITMTTDGVHWLKPYPAHKCKDYARRGYDLPVNGLLVVDPDARKQDGDYDSITFLVHCNVPCRLPPTSREVANLTLVSSSLPGYMRKAMQ